jgi:hypothetical protein
MAHTTDQTKLILRERWLPLVTELAQLHHWELRGEQLEAMLDALVPYLTQPGVTRPEIATAIVCNYYNDGALVALLCAGDDDTREAAWMLIEQVIRDLLAAQRAPDSFMSTAAQVKHMRSIVEHELPRYTFQSSLRLAIARIIGSERGSSDRV